MPSLIVLRKGRMRISAAVLVLLMVALVLPQLTWADSASDHTVGQFDNLSSISPSEAQAVLLEKYRTGELLYHALGDQQDRSSTTSINPGLTDPALLAAYPEVVTYRRNVEAYLRYFAQQDCSELATQSEVSAYRRNASMNPGLTDPALLAAYPEVLTYRRNVDAYLRYFAQQDCPDLAPSLEAMASQHSAAINPGLTEPALLAAYPEVVAYRRNVEAFLQYFAQQDCSDLAANSEVTAYQRSALTKPGLTDPDLLAAYPEVAAYRRSVEAYLRYLAQGDCSQVGS